MFMENVDTFVPKSTIVFREELDNWGLLFEPDTAACLVLNPVGVLIWKNLNGQNKVADLETLIRQECEDVPENIKNDIVDFLETLLKAGFVERVSGR